MFGTRSTTYGKATIRKSVVKEKGQDKTHKERIKMDRRKSLAEGRWNQKV